MQCRLQRFFQGYTSFLSCGGLLFVGFQQLDWVAEVVGFLVRVFDVEVVAAGFDFGDGDAPGVFVFLAIMPPGFFEIEFRDGDGAGFGVVFVGRRAWGARSTRSPRSVGPW